MQIAPRGSKKKNEKNVAQSKMLTKVPQFAIMYSAQNRQQAARDTRLHEAPVRPKQKAKAKKQDVPSTNSVCMETVQEEDDDYILV
jgi:hypothetical protein